MIFLIIIAALFAERYLLEQEDFRRHLWFKDYCLWFKHLPLAGWFGETRGAIIALLFLPLAVLLIIQSWAVSTWGGIPEWFLSFFILLLTLGPKDIEHQVTNFLDARDHGGSERASRFASEIMCREATEKEPELSILVSESVVEQANSRLMAVIFWFVLLGPFGAVLYRLTCLAESYSRDSEEHNLLNQQAFHLLHILDWLPARLLAATYALVGNFDNVLMAWRLWSDEQRDSFDSDAKGLLIMTGSAAVGHTPKSPIPEDIDDLPPLVEDALGLILRSLSIWVVLLAVIQLAVWLT